MTASFPYRQTKALLLEHLKKMPTGSYDHAVNGVVELALRKGLYQTRDPAALAGHIVAERYLQGHDRREVPELVRQLMWRLLIEGVLVFGKDNAGRNANWPWYRLTGYGEQVVQQLKPQPYDPDGFLAEYKNVVLTGDPVVYDYLDEAVRAFNHDCPKAAAILLGGASEKAVLLLHETFGQAITDPRKKSKFDRDSKHWTISTKYGVLKDRLDRMVSAKKFQQNKDLAETVKSQLPGVFESIKRCRNSAGHPDAVGTVERDTVFLNLRVFIEYMRRVFDLIAHFKVNPADW